MTAVRRTKTGWSPRRVMAPACVLILLYGNIFFAPVIHAIPAGVGLADPDRQPKFQVMVPNALDPSFHFNTSFLNHSNDKNNSVLQITVSAGIATTGLVGPDGETPVDTPIWGYGTPAKGYTWPGRTVEVQKGVPLRVQWINDLPIAGGYLLKGKNNTNINSNVTSRADFTNQSVVDTTIHWAYSIPGYTSYNIETDGTPIVVHLHGGHTESASDGHPEQFFSPNYTIRGPLWNHTVYTYDNDQPATTLWYHDHTLGLTRLNVYTGMAGFYIIRDDLDTGKPDNPLHLPAFPYEAALVIQDRMFQQDGRLFYPAFPGDTNNGGMDGMAGMDMTNSNNNGMGGMDMPTSNSNSHNGHTMMRRMQTMNMGDGMMMPGKGGGMSGTNATDPMSPSVRADFFGDHIVVNGKIWPKMNVEPRHYRLRFLNGCDSRFLVLEMQANTTQGGVVPTIVPFLILGRGQGFGSGNIANRTRVVLEPGARVDVVVDFGAIDFGNRTEKRVVLKNYGGDKTFSGEVPGPQVYEHTDEIMAFDVVTPLDKTIPDRFDKGDFQTSLRASRYRRAPPTHDRVNRVRNLGLFVGMDGMGRHRAMLGTVEPATDDNGNAILWPTDGNTPDDLSGKPMEGALAFHAPTTEIVRLGDIEDWVIWNVSPHTHPIHLHSTDFFVIRRSRIHHDSNADAQGMLPEGAEPAGDGTYMLSHPVMQHDGSMAMGFRIQNATMNEEPLDLRAIAEYVDYGFPRDTVAVRPGEAVRIRAKFDRPGTYVWHCHILSDEDYDMMRPLEIRPRRQRNLRSSEKMP